MQLQHAECEHTRRDLEAHAQNTLLPLRTNVLWPFHKASEVLDRLGDVSDAECLGCGLEQWILGLGCCSRRLHHQDRMNSFQ